MRAVQGEVFQRSQYRFKDARALLEAIEYLPPSGVWKVPKDGFNIEPLAREFLARQGR